MLWLAGVPHGSPSEYISDRLDMSYENCHAATHAKEGNGGNFTDKINCGPCLNTDRYNRPSSSVKLL